MVVLHVAPINTTLANGFRFSVPGLISAQEKLGIHVALLNIAKPEFFCPLKLERRNIKVFLSNKVTDLETPFNRPDIVIFHGVYETQYLRIYKQLLDNNIPYVIVPRVSLTKGAQSQKNLKKKIANFLFFNNFINNSASIHYLTNNERNLSSDFQHESFVIGNGVDLPVLNCKIIENKVNLTFIGRYDVVHKGLDILVCALTSIRRYLLENDVHISFFGSDFHNGKDKLLKLVKSHQLESIVNINDAVFGKEKEEVLRNTDIFLAPSRFEGHPMAVLEAMSYGVACILTEGTNMTMDTIKYDSGWIVDLSSDQIAKKIIEALQNPKEIRNKGYNARRLIEENYTWDKIAIQTIDQYNEILN